MIVRRILRKSPRIIFPTLDNWLQASRASTWTMKLFVSRLSKWLEERSTPRHLLRSIRWYQWMMKIKLLITTTKDGSGYSSLGVQLMFTLISPTLWNSSLEEAAKEVTQACIFQQQKKTSLQKRPCKFFMLLSKDQRKLIQTATNPWINLRLPALSMLQWRRSPLLARNKPPVPVQASRRVDSFLL